MKLKLDPLREERYYPTGIYVRAENENNKMVTVDIIELDKESLVHWLRSDGGKNPLAENVIGVLFGHGNQIAS